MQAAADGEEAMNTLAAAPFDVALMDLVMPKATGIEILRRLQHSKSTTSVVMITGHGSIDVAVEAMKAGAVDFLVKPFEIESLQRILQSIADERQARQLLERPTTSADARKALLQDAAQRKAFLAVVGPGATPPSGATRVLRIAEDAETADVFTPSQLYRLNASIDEVVNRTERPLVYAAGLGVIEEVHGRDDLKAWIRHVSGRCAAKRGSLILAGANPALVAEIEAELGVARAEPDLQGMLESLANPIRRAIVSYVFSSGPAAYSSILKMDFVDSSSKLSFHLQKLQADRLLEKDRQGAYALTEDGRRAWRVVRALSEERHRPSVMFDSA